MSAGIPAKKLSKSTPPQPAPEIAPPALPEKGDSGTVYLKQNGKIYSVKDWATLRGWVADRRVDKHDLVSDGGVRWEPIGTHAELASLFVSDTPPPIQSTPSFASTPSRAPPSLPFDDTPFGAHGGGDAWTDEDTEGIPLGLPSLVELSRPIPKVEPPEPLGADPVAVEYELKYEPTDEVPVTASVVEVDSDVLVAASLKMARSDKRGQEQVDEQAVTDTPQDTTEPAQSRASHAPLDPTRTGPTGRYRKSTPERPAPIRVDPKKPAPIRIELLPETPLRPDRSEALTEKLDLRALGYLPGAGQPADLGEVTQQRPRPTRAEEPTVPLPSSDFPFDTEWEQEQEHRPMSTRWLWLGAVLLTSIVMLPLGWWILTGQLSETEPPSPPVPVVVPAPVVQAPVVQAPVVQAPVAPVAAPAPEPPPEPPALIEQPAPPTPVPARPLPSSASQGVSTLIERGWDAADRKQWIVSERWFQRALDQSPKDEEATFGVGYALLMQSKTKEATAFLCRVRAARSEDLLREVKGIISEHKIVCE